MGRGKFKSKPTGRRQFSTPEDMAAGTSSRPKTFRQKEAEHEEESEQESEEVSENESGEESEGETKVKRLALIRQQRAEAAKKREEEKAAKEQKKAEARK
ncbi:hypothetical protein Ahy_B03g063150 [Arachis hypogaea]|uniref:Casein kinase substrate phosphoprotein PP28 domain-containing protein n=1 Tax=Arachis hypogaea TaxID=3818 RepID=A0A444ZWC4_ARAHY|nr:hypothetical protein Ahy_B03g063150 [Arachis hypogaea]